MNVLVLGARGTVGSRIVNYIPTPGLGSGSLGVITADICGERCDYAINAHDVRNVLHVVRAHDVRGIVHAVGTRPPTPLHDLNLEDLEQNLREDALLPVLLLREILRYWDGVGVTGRYLQLTSMRPFTPTPDCADYAMAKGALNVGVASVCAGYPDQDVALWSPGSGALGTRTLELMRHFLLHGHGGHCRMYWRDDQVLTFLPT
jgi:hypothetical protein